MIPGLCSMSDIWILSQLPVARDLMVCFKWRYCFWCPIDSCPYSKPSRCLFSKGSGAIVPFSKAALSNIRRKRCGRLVPRTGRFVKYRTGEILKKCEMWSLDTGWWFGTFFIFPYIGNNHPNWLIFFRGVQTTNQDIIWGFPKSWGYPHLLVWCSSLNHPAIGVASLVPWKAPFPGHLDPAECSKVAGRPTPWENQDQRILWVVLRAIFIHFLCLNNEIGPPWINEWVQTWLVPKKEESPKVAISTQNYWCTNKVTDFMLIYFFDICWPLGICCPEIWIRKMMTRPGATDDDDHSFSCDWLNHDLLGVSSSPWAQKLVG